MHFITTLKSSGEIIDYRIDNSAPAYWTVEKLKSSVSADRNISEDSLETFAFTSLPAIADGASIDALTPSMHSYDVATGTLKNNPSYVAPATERKFGLTDVVAQLTLAEKTKFINKSTPTVVTAISEFGMPRNQADTTEILQFLVNAGDITQASMDKILA